MPFRKSLSLRPVNSVKHEVVWSNLGQNAVSPGISIEIIKGVVPANVNLSTEVEIGSTVKWVYIEMHFSAAQTGNVNVIHWAISKEPFGTAISDPATYFQTDRRFILKRGMEMIPVNVATVFKRIFVVRIPPRMRRIGEADKIVLQYTASSTQTINACGFAIYKSFN